MTPSAIKGTVFDIVTADILRLIEDGAISREEVEARLEVEDLVLLDSKIMVAGWYPVNTYARMVELLRDVEGGGDDAYLVERGRIGAKRIAATGIYSQLENIPEKREMYGERFDRIMSSLGPAIFRDVTFTPTRKDEGSGPPGYFLRLHVPRDFPGVSRHPVPGFDDYLTEIYLEDRKSVV